MRVRTSWRCACLKQSSFVTRELIQDLPVISLCLFAIIYDQKLIKTFNKNNVLGVNNWPKNGDKLSIIHQNVAKINSIDEMK